MAKINFQQFKVAQDIAHKEFKTIDIREGLANNIYNAAGGVKALDLAMRIYKSEGEAEYDDHDVRIIRAVIENSTYNCAVLDAFSNSVSSKKEG